MSEDKSKSKIPTSDDSFRFSPQQVTPGTTMGGMQTGGYASTPSTQEPKPEWTPSPPDSMIRRTVLKTEK